MRHLTRNTTGALLMAPCLIWIGFFFILPIVLLAINGFREGGLASYETVFTSPVYSKVLGNTLRVAVVTTVCTLLLGYPIAYMLTVLSGWWRAVALVMVIVPYWLDYIVRSYAWLVLLGREGLINRLLISLGIIEQPIAMLYNLFSVTLAMTQILLPLMILTLFGAMLRIDRRLLDAAAIHGASRTRAFLTVFLPLSMPGIYGASLLVFVVAMGFYVTPALLGSPSETMISQTIMILATELLNWSVASAAGVILLVFSVAILVVYNLVFGMDRLFGGDGKS
ncbi:ABC transporter permease [Acuticoccus mangrovi]|uniref:ABC transporter permease n=1 Tax=Acuticoccus mangrovi TaxID=2796142 RepID=A0A934MIF4_9HYPH|nr:ABC transporter permease [Acuticoccus mangrovi]MBJ3777865.1 ABC transporter permease [Acuticoccus mangrovi]